jgi:hypothetical protein
MLLPAERAHRNPSPILERNWGVLYVNTVRANKRCRLCPIGGGRRANFITIRFPLSQIAHFHGVSSLIRAFFEGDRCLRSLGEEPPTPLRVTLSSGYCPFLLFRVQTISCCHYTTFLVALRIVAYRIPTTLSPQNT